MKYNNMIELLRDGYAPVSPQTAFNMFNLGTTIERKGLMAKQGAALYLLHPLKSRVELASYLRVVAPTQTATQTAIKQANTQRADTYQPREDGTLQALVGVWFNELVFNKGTNL